VDQEVVERVSPCVKRRVRLMDRIVRILRISKNKVKVLIAMFFAVVFGAFGDISLRYAMRPTGCIVHPSLYSNFLCVISHPFIWIGIGCLIAFFILYLVSLSWEELSYVLPLTAAVYVLVTILAFFILGENVSIMRWMGSILVASGIALVVRT